MNYFGDIEVNGTIEIPFNTNNSNGAAVTFTGTTVKVYKDNATGTEVTTGVTLSKDHDGITGAHIVTVVCTDAFYAVGSNYLVLLEAATIDSQTVNAWVGYFSIEHRTAVTTLTEGTITYQQAMRIFLSVFTGLSEGGGSTKLKFRDLADTKYRLELDVDSNGNRVAVTTRDGT